MCFIQKYLNTLNIKTNNDLFKENSIFFRNALVRSQYSNKKQNIDYDYSYLINFFERLINKKGSINNIYEIKVSGSDCQIISFDLVNQKVLIRFSDNKEKSINLEKIDF